MKKRLSAQLRHRVTSTRRISLSGPVRSNLGYAGFFRLRGSIILLVCTAAVCWIVTGIPTTSGLAFFRSEPAAPSSHRTLSFAERVTYQRAIEEVYWRHRIWPKENPYLKPSLDAVMSQTQLEKKVEDYLRKSQALEDYWQQPITAEDLQAEIDRMTENTKQADVLRELFDALGNDPFLIAECLARPVLSERLITSFAQEQQEARLALSEVGANIQTRKVILANTSYVLPTISDAATGCTPDSWTNTSTTNAPTAREEHTAVWTGIEMIIWGGLSGCCNRFDTGARYNPSTDSWTATSVTNAPTPRSGHTAVWTGSEMIVWGGGNADKDRNSGGRYNPITDSWTFTSTINPPTRRHGHTAVWTGSEMVVWGGNDGTSDVNTGGKYDPSSDGWTATNTANAPSGRESHTAVLTSEMIVWGGYDGTSDVNTGGKYDPASDSWTATSTANAPSGRESHTAVLTGTEMIVWGGDECPGLPECFLNTGGRYNPVTNSWTTTSTANAPSARSNHAAVWTGSEMIIWGGLGPPVVNTGGRYCAETGAPTPTPTPTATATATATPTPTPTSTPTPTPTPTPCTGRCTPTPRPRPTPAPRPSPQ